MEDPSQTKILDLPEGVLFDIMKLAGRCSKINDNIRCVCKQFYSVYCAHTSCGLTLASNQIRDDVFDSMMHSLRRPFRFSIEIPEECTKNSKLKKIVERFAIHVQTLRFKRCPEKTYRHVDVAMIMNLMVRVQEILFDELEISEYHARRQTIQMPMLRKIILVDCSDAESIDSLLSCVSARSLKELCILGRTDNALDFDQFFKSNQIINSVEMRISRNESNFEALEHLRLSKLQISLDRKSNVSAIRDVIARQPKLKYLDLLPDQREDPYWFDEYADAKGHDDLLTTICCLKELRSLKIAIRQVTPDALGKIADLTNLRELVMSASGNGAYYNKSYDDIKMSYYIHLQKCFRKLIATSLPNLESFAWSLKNCKWSSTFMERALQTEHSSLGPIDIIATMAPNYPSLKYLRIEMKTKDVIYQRGYLGNVQVMYDSLSLLPLSPPIIHDRINVRYALTQFPLLETLQLKASSTFDGGPISMHTHIKHVKINEIEKDLLIKMLELMPNLETVSIRNTLFSLNKTFLKRLQAAIPHRLKKLKLKFNSPMQKDFAVANVAILQNILRRLQSGKVELSGNCNFKVLAQRIDRSTSVSLFRSQKCSFPGYFGVGDVYMQLWK